MLLLPLLFACQPHKPTEPIRDPPHPGMVKIEAAGKSFTQGWDSPLASTAERPGMPTTFSYDYWLDSTEVTQKEFREVTGRNPVPDTSHAGVGDGYPVYDVSWYDAALFCNARSKREGLDTVYRYSAVNRQANGSVFNLAGLQCDLSKDGYRLPTEAEWEFAARGASAALPYSSVNDTLQSEQEAWFSRNSGGASHPVATLHPNALGIYDLAGNVFEWTNDWKAPYTGKPITDPVGARYPNDQFEKVIKGGAFNFDYQYLRPSGRSSEYATTLSSTADYVGFRCARGGIASPAFLDSVTSGQTNPVTLLESDPQTAFHSPSARIVFVNVTGSTRTLCSVDFASPHPYVQECDFGEPIYAPAISPDGKFVAYSTAGVGSFGASRIKIRPFDSLQSAPAVLQSDSAFLPHWWVDPSTSDTLLLYTNSAVPNGQSMWNSTATFAQRIRNGKPVGDPMVLTSNGGFHDGRSSDARYLFTGYQRLLRYDFQSMQTDHLFVSPHNGKGSAESDQVCNVSAGSDSATCGQCMFLDFGSSSPSTITGSSYRPHQILFIANSSDSVLSWLGSPPGENEWDFPRWSNQGRYAVASARDLSENAHAIYSIDLWSGTFRQLLSGIELEQPCLWIAGASGLTPGEMDSLGAYNDPAVHATQARFAVRMHYFWQLRDSIRYAFVGSSHSSVGIDPHSFNRSGVCNLAYGQCDPRGTRSMIYHYILNHCPNVKLIGTELIMGWYCIADGMNSNFSTALGASKGFMFDSSRNFWKTGLSDPVKKALIDRPYTSIAYLDSMTREGMPIDIGWEGENPSMFGGGGWDTSSAMYKQNFAELRALIGDLQSRGIHLLMYVAPENPAFAAHGFAGRYGPDLEVGKIILSQIKQLGAEFPNFHLYDADLFGQHDYADSEAADADHLNLRGAQKLSHRLDSVISTFMDK